MDSCYQGQFSDEHLPDRGKAVAPDGPGLGINVDWEKLATAGFCVYEELDLSVSLDKPLHY